MTLYSSGKHDKLTADPEPYIDQWGIDRNEDGDPAGYDFDAQFSYDPRPEFDRPLTNPANPLLVRFRILRSEPDAAEAAAVWIRVIGLGHYNADHSRKVREHARRVLTRLANLTEQEQS